MTDILRVENEYYVRATSALADDRTRVLKCGDTFAVFNRYGDMEALGPVQFGIFYMESRHLSRFVLRVNQRRPMLLSSTVREDNAFVLVDLTNLDAPVEMDGNLPRGTVHIFRSIFLDGSSCYMQFRFLNYGVEPVRVTADFEFDADFADIFEVRGTPRERRGRRLATEINEHEAILAYEGLDRVRRRTRLRFSPDPDFIRSEDARFQLALQPKERATIYATIVCEQAAGKEPAARRYSQAYEELAASTAETPLHECVVKTSSKRFNALLARSEADLDMLTRGNVEGPYPYAGVPWFSTVFGRDGIITALECLWMTPRIARCVLENLAKTQASAEIPEQDAEPGKIIHEIRRGEMAALKEVPFGCYYGSVDSTPLFLLLTGEYWKRTGDLEFIEQIWPNVERALEWVATYGDEDGDGFVEYQQKSEKGLRQQGWKDSQDSVFHDDGRLAEGPIALCEVQAYVYAAKRSLAAIARARGMEPMAERLCREAEELRERFEEKFWSEELGMYVLALDGRKRQCKVRSSNAGHALYCGIASAERARRTGRNLLTEAMFSGWGVRTIGANESRYNPMSYHNGSVWPHDNALIGFGLTRYAMHAETTRILMGLYEASLDFDLRRLPELFCGFHRRADAMGPTRYPVACLPQAWAAGSVYLLLQACLGIEILAPEKKVAFVVPVLPPNLDEIRIESLRVGDASADLLFRRSGRDVWIEAERRRGNLEIVKSI
ncbi:MAG TPA: amylo-alpha-1,6-glucosidase [Candidatus Acidoferrales bacterium]|nr:amylo-alpha-1,6-glucosidase [Candidatus Acidoferrales bacterium]